MSGSGVPGLAWGRYGNRSAADDGSGQGRSAWSSWETIRAAGWARAATATTARIVWGADGKRTDRCNRARLTHTSPIHPKKAAISLPAPAGRVPVGERTRRI